MSNNKQYVDIISLLIMQFFLMHLDLRRSAGSSAIIIQRIQRFPEGICSVNHIYWGGCHRFNEPQITFRHH
jgi:hypothetical protein